MEAQIFLHLFLHCPLQGRVRSPVLNAFIRDCRGQSWLLPSLPTPLSEVPPSSLWPQRSLLPGSVDTKAQLSSAQIGGPSLKRQLLSSWDRMHLARPKLGGSWAGYSKKKKKKEGWGIGRRKLGRSLYHDCKYKPQFVVQWNHRIWLGRKFSARSCMQIGHQVMAKICSQMEVPLQGFCVSKG